ncbi:type I secretion outer membrane protein, TolC precursor [Sulfuriferula multivorans]|uniref:Type I secretion outer membrane protein, TolC n=1 Tax=Sulfuriferula multivorans TaxID=1559896 RepID=A0A401J9A6_9PROT|nr:TolC family outer membrane protein [Sulfuriferula multivorans]GBL44255.1 type I secretion outer membrane protein, TolC precursor [Sulfuriferula multivorans]
MKQLSLALIGIGFSHLALAANLSDIYHQAQNSDAAYASARAAYRAGVEKLPQGRAGLLPQASLNASVLNNDTQSSLFGNMNYTSRSAAVTVTQPIYRKQNWEQYEQAKQQVSAAEAQLASGAQDLILRTAQAYFDVLQSQDNINFVRAQKAAIGEQLAQAKRNFEVGTATITDSNEAQARSDLANAQGIAALNDLQIKQRALQRIIGTMPPKLDALGDKLQLAPPNPANMDVWIARAELGSPVLKAQLAGYEIARREVERNRAGHYPTLDAVASYSDNRNQNFGGFQVNTKNAVIGVEFNLPLYQGGLVGSRVREAVANQDKARADLEDARRQVDLNTSQAYLGVTSGEAQVKALEQALISSQTSLDSTRLGFEVGVRTTVDVLNAQQQLYSAKRDLAAARYNYILSGLRLKAAAGTLSEMDLGEVDKWLVSNN